MEKSEKVLFIKKHIVASGNDYQAIQKGLPKGITPISAKLDLTKVAGKNFLDLYPTLPEDKRQGQFEGYFNETDKPFVFIPEYYWTRGYERVTINELKLEPGEAYLRIIDSQEGIYYLILKYYGEPAVLEVSE